MVETPSLMVATVVGQLSVNFTSSDDGSYADSADSIHGTW